MRYTEEARIRLHGDREAAALLIPRARTLLGNLMQRNAGVYEGNLGSKISNSVVSNKPRNPLGVIQHIAGPIRVSIYGGIPTIDIFAPPKDEEVQQQIKPLILAVGHDSAPYVTFYSIPRSDDGIATEVKLIADADLPTSRVGKLFFSQDYKYLAVPFVDPPYMYLYEWDEEISQYKVKTIPPPEGFANSGAFTYGNVWEDTVFTMVLALSSLPLMAVYFLGSSGVVNKLVIPDNFRPPAGPAWATSISPDNTWMVIGHGGANNIGQECVISPNFTTYKFDSLGIEKLAWWDDFCGVLKENDGPLGGFHAPLSGTAVAFSQDSTRLYLGTVGDRYGVFEYSVAGSTPSRIREMEFTAFNISKSLASYGENLLGHTHWGDSNASIYNTSTSSLVARNVLGAQFESEHCAFSSDGFFAVASWRSTQPNVKVYKPSTYEPVTITNARTDGCFGVGFAELEIRDVA